MHYSIPQRPHLVAPKFASFPLFQIPGQTTRLERGNMNSFPSFLTNNSKRSTTCIFGHGSKFPHFLLAPRESRSFPSLSNGLRAPQVFNSPFSFRRKVDDRSGPPTIPVQTQFPMAEPPASSVASEPAPHDSVSQGGIQHEVKRVGAM